MESAWVKKIADALRSAVALRADSVLAAFGGAGPLVATRIADATGIERVLIPGLAAVFSVFGVGFSDVSHECEQLLDRVDAAGLAAARTLLTARAEREMFAEGVDLKECTIETRLVIGERSVRLVDDKLPKEAQGARDATLIVQITKAVPRVKLTGHFGKERRAVRATGVRRTLMGTKWAELALYSAAELAGGASGEGPIVVEEAFFTSRIDAGWRFELSSSGDFLLTKLKGVKT